MKRGYSSTTGPQELFLANEELKKTKADLIKASQLYAFISQINQKVVRISDQETLFRNACEIALEFGKFRMAWIGIFDKEDKTVSLAYHCGIPDNDIDLFTKISYRNKNLQSQVLQTGQSFICTDIENDLELRKWKSFAEKNGIHSFIVLPIKKGGVIIGTFNLYSSDTDFSSEKEIKLLLEMTGDISFALDLFEREKLHSKIKEERFFAQKSIEESEARYRAFFENSMDGILLTVADGEILSANPAACKMFRMTELEICDKGRHGMVDLSDPRANRLIKERQKTGKAKGELTFQRKDGSKFIGEISSVLFRDSKGEKKTSMIIRDITERTEAEKQREFDKHNLNALINNTKDLMWSVDRDYNLITSNLAFDESVKSFSGEIISKGSSVFLNGFTKESTEKYKEIYDRAFSGEVFLEFEQGDVPSDYWLEISYNPIRDKDKIIGVACHSRNVTNTKLTEREREKMITEIIQHSKNLEQFAHIVSHNLRAPVVNILGLSTVLKSEISNEDRTLVQQYLFKAVGQLDEVVTDLNKILKTKSDMTESKENVSLTILVEDIQSSIQSLIEKENVRIIFNFSKIGQINTIKSYLHSIFYNLITNSIKYKHAGRPPVIRIASSFENGMIRISFKDNGSGIDLKLQGGKIFGLYKRFHENIEGKGFGLFMVKTQVETLGGKISVKSEPNIGTEFIIELPI